MYQSKRKTNIVLVSFSAWRCGSSMMVGLMEQLGANIGSVKRATRVNIENPFGSFESHLHIFGQRVMSPYWEMFNVPPPQKEMLNILAHHLPEFNKRCSAEEYGDSEWAATKCMMGGLIPLAQKSTSVNCHVIWLRRNTRGQARSLCASAGITGTKRGEVHDWVCKQDVWLEVFMKEVKCNPVEVWFEDMLDDPVGCTKKICDHIGMPMVDAGIPRGWVHKEFSRSKPA